jgi:hypothetical protein
MTVCILQPSYIPWKGHFHQIAESDVFVFFDTVQYDRRGWRNRNTIKYPQGTCWLTIPVYAKGTHQGLLIKDVHVAKPDWADHHLQKIRSSYSKAPCFTQEFPWVEDMLRTVAGRYTDISHISAETIRIIAEQIGLIKTRFVYASELGVVTQDRNDRLLQIIQSFQDTSYISGPSARDYMDLNLFEQAGIDVTFMHYDYPEYPQLYPPFTHAVSILDMIFMLGATNVGNYIWSPTTQQPSVAISDTGDLLQRKRSAKNLREQLAYGDEGLGASAWSGESLK